MKNAANSSPAGVCFICDDAYHGHQQIGGDHRQSLSSPSCGRRIPTTRGSRRGDDRGMDLQLCGQLPVILLARKILRIPSQFLESLLRDNGDPSQWGIDLCRACMGVFKKAELIHSKIIKLIEEFEGLADNLREELRESDRKKSCKKKGAAETKGRAIKKELIRNVMKSASASMSLRQEFLRIVSKNNQEAQADGPQDIKKGSRLKTRNTGTCGLEDFTRIGKFELEVDEGDVFNSDDIMDHDDSSSPQCFEETGDTSADMQSESRSIPESPLVEANLNGSSTGNLPNSEDAEEDKLKEGKKESKTHLDTNDDHNSGGTIQDDGSDKDPSILIIQSRTLNSSEVLYCDICPKRKRRRKKYKTKDILESHKRKVHQKMKKPFECKLCGKFFAANVLLHRHLLRHPKMDSKIKSRPFCEECNREFKSMARLRDHLQTRRHLPPGSILPDKKKKNPEARKSFRYECIECDRKFETRGGLHSHMTTTKYHNPVSKYQCEFCSKSFMQKPSLDNHHARDHHAELNIEPIQCAVCGKKFSSKRNLEHHVRVQHTKNTPFRCTECNMGFMSTLMYNRHVINVHTKDKQFQCTDCPKRFSDSTQLNIHMRVHSGEKPLKCKDCGKEYADPPTFKRHQETHGDTTYVCSFCGRQFKVWHSYRIHMKKHNQHLTKLSNQTVSVPAVPEGDSSNVDSTPAPASEDSAAQSLP